MGNELYTDIIAFGKKLLSLEHIDDTLEMISEEAKTLLQAERCSIFIVDKSSNMLWSKVADGIGRIAIALDAGIAGATVKTQQPQLVNDPYENAHFLPKIDEKSGFETRNILTTPIFGSRQEVIGIIQLLNKANGDFTPHDVEVLRFLANYISGTLELILLKEEL